LATESPDDATVQVNRIALYVNTGGGAKMLANPMDTKRKAFVFAVTEKGKYFLRINDTMLQDNKGSATYRVTIGRAKN
jgi:predicted  nucleic acid-binding Zn-ribbon protein